MTDESAKEASDRYLNELNAQALAANLSELRTHYEDRIDALENAVAANKTLLLNMQQVYGKLLQEKMGSGRTEQDR